MRFAFFGYDVRATTILDEPLAIRSTLKGDPRFWLAQGHGRESFLVTHRGNLIAFFQIEQITKNIPQARLHFQSFPEASPKAVLRGVLKLVPLIEKALALRGLQAVFFTSHSKSMVEFMQSHLGYTPAGDGGRDGEIMSKRLRAEG